MAKKNKRDYYDVLGVNKDASANDIKLAFRKLAMKYHPDRNKAPDAQDRFKEGNEAYMVLSDQEKRQKYDRFGFDGPDMGQGFSGSGFSGFSDIFDMFFDGFGGGGGGGRRSSRRSRRQVRGDDVEVPIVLKFGDVVSGVKKEIKYNRLEPCSQCDGLGAQSKADVKTCSRCKGSGQVAQTQRTILGMMQSVGECPSCRGVGEEIKKPCTKCKGKKVMVVKAKTSVKIPAGVDSGMIMNVQGHGHIPTKDAIPGDLHLVIRVKKDPRFEREGYDIHSVVKCSFAQAITGCSLSVETVDGPTKIKIAPGTQPETHMRLRNKGIPILNNRSKQRGNQIITVRIDIPKYSKLSKKQQQLITSYLETQESGKV
jgi:molecular chaperone DnaJ